MDQLNCFICNNQVQGSLNGLSNHLTRVHGLTISRGMGNKGFECGQDGCGRKYIHFSSLRKHIKEHHLLQSNHPFEEVIIPQQDFYYIDDEVENQKNILDNGEDIINERNVLDDHENIHVHSNNENIDFDLRQLILQMIARFQSKGSVTGTLLTDVLNEFEQVILSIQNFLKIKVQTFLQNRQLLEDEEAKLVLKAFNFNNPFRELRSLNEKIDVLREHCNYMEPKEISLENRLDQVFDEKTSMSESELVMDVCQYEPTLETSVQPQPHCSKDNPSISRNSSCFSRYGTIKETLQKYSQGVKILNAAQSSFTEQHRKLLIRLTVEELVKVYDSYYPPELAKSALAKAIVAEFPRLRNEYSSEGHEHYYDEQTKKGFIEFRLWTMRKKLSPTKRKYKKTVKENKTIDFNVKNISIEEMNEKISMLKSKNPTKENKKIIIKGLEDTHVFRRFWITAENPTLTQIFEMYPRLRDYNGEMINIEFKKMFPELNDNLLSKFPSYYTPHILQYAKKFHIEVFKKSQTIKNEQLKALLILAELLRVSNGIKNKKTETNKTNDKGKKRLFSDRNKEETISLKPDFPNKELLQFISEGTIIDNFEKTVDNQSHTNIQPHLVFMNERELKISFIQGDGWQLRLPEGFTPLQAFDILYKFFHVFNLKYPLTLLNFYNFMDTYIYRISMNPHSVVSSLHINICNVKMDECDSSD